MEITIAFCAWALKELYQNYIGSRAKTLSVVQELEKKIIALEITLNAQTRLINKLEDKIEKLNTIRAYRN